MVNLPHDLLQLVVAALLSFTSCSKDGIDRARLVQFVESVCGAARDRLTR